jgi:hypothetical protein
MTGKSKAVNIKSYILSYKAQNSLTALPWQWLYCINIKSNLNMTAGESKGNYSPTLMSSMLPVVYFHAG